MLIMSPQNPLIKSIKTLHTAKGRRTMNAYLMEGRKVIEEALRDCHPVQSIFMDVSITDEQLENMARHNGVELHRVSQRVIQSLCDTVTPQGMVAVMTLPPPADITQVAKRGELIIILDMLQDPGNLGAIIRTADAVGAAAVLVGANGVEPYTPKVIRACMGSQLHLPVIRSIDLQKDVQKLRDEQFTIVAATLSGKNFFKRNFDHAPIALIIGNESRGVTPELTALADMQWTLPMVGQAESLNAAVAAGVFLYELSRWRMDMIE